MKTQFKTMIPFPRGREIKRSSGPMNIGYTNNNFTTSIIMLILSILVKVMINFDYFIKSKHMECELTNQQTELPASS